MGGPAATTTVKTVELAAPPRFVTVMGPVVAPSGIGTTICVRLIDDAVATTLLENFTVTVPVKLVPLMVTELRMRIPGLISLVTGLASGLMLEMVGTGGVPQSIEHKPSS